MTDDNKDEWTISKNNIWIYLIFVAASVIAVLCGCYVPLNYRRYIFKWQAYREHRRNQQRRNRAPEQVGMDWLATPPPPQRRPVERLVTQVHVPSTRIEAVQPPL